MTKPSDLGSVSAYVRDRIHKLLDEYRVVVWYDPEEAFSEFINQLALQGCVIVSAVDSKLRARRAAEATYRWMNEGNGSLGVRNNLLIYIPSARGATPEEQQRDPFEGFARCGAIFGDQEGEHLSSLAQLALPERAEEITRLFQEGRPTLDLLNMLPTSAQYPLVRQALDVESPMEVVVTALSAADSAEKLERVPGALVELERLIKNEFGLSPNLPESWPSIRNRLATYLLVSELSFDLPSGLPEALANVPHAEPIYRQRIFDVCDRLRESDVGREVYIQLASQVERDLRLPSLLKQTLPLGSRDTFSCQEHLRLQSLVRTAADGDLVSARSLLSIDERSVWRRDPERALLWGVAQRCVTFLELAAHAQSYMPANDTRSLVDAYVATDGLWKLDRAQRLYEYAAAQCAQDDSVEPLVQRCRVLYNTAVQRVQAAFQTVVLREGWPPERMRRQTQTFDSFVLPELALRHKIAYFLVDSLRYEMGRDLAEALHDLGSMSIESVVTVLPTTTPCGMAALMPGADGAFTFTEHRGELIPTIGGNRYLE
jgi:PglZ domain